MNHILTIIIVVINHQIPLNHHFPAGFPMVFAMNLPQERTFDPVLESQQRCAEERERVAHLNRAKGIQILREQPFNILSQDWIIYII